MTNKENELVKEHIKVIIKRTFEIIKKVYGTQKEGKGKGGDFCESGSRIIFPKYSGQYRNGETRISEQELRFIFVEQFNKYCEDKLWNAYYSVETPTEEKYVFSSKDKGKVVPHKVTENEAGGQSAMIDLSIHDKDFNRIALIEFKALNPGKPAFDKDFCKLKNEPGSPATFFVMIVKSHDGRTVKSLHEKIEAKDSNTEFYCYDLEEGKEGKDISEEIIKGIPTSDK